MLCCVECMKLTCMKRKSIGRLFILAIILLGFLLVIKLPETIAPGSNCEESIDRNSKKSDVQTPSGNMIWENLSAQFFSSL